jgi:hypothetical protein
MAMVAAVLTVFAASTPATVSLGRVLRASSQGSYDNAAIADKALTYVGRWGGEACRDAGKLDSNGTTVAGYGGGQCRTFVNCVLWLVSNGSQYPTGTYFQSFLDNGGQEITDINNLVKGDIVQSGDGVHTFIIVSHISGDTFDVVDSNHNLDEMVNHYHRSGVVLNSDIRAFRMGTVNGTPPPPVKEAVSVAVSSSANPSAHGQAITLTAAVTPQGSTANTPSGAVQLLDGGAQIGAGNLTGGTFAVTTSSLTIGAHSITATYAGDTNFLGGQSAIFDQVVNKTPTTTTMTSSSNPSVFGQPVTLTATVTSGSGQGIPSGTVHILQGATTIASATLTNATYNLTLTSLPVGTYPLTATYDGDSDFLPSASPVINQIVNKAPTDTALGVSPTSSTGFGNPVTFTATVTVPPPGAGTPTGTITFAVDGTPVAERPLAAALAATITTSSLSPGNHSIAAAYHGDANFLPSTAAHPYLITCAHTITGKHLASVVAAGASTCILDAQIGGAIIVPSGTALAVEHSTVAGAIAANTTPHAIQVCGATIGGSVGVSGAHGIVIIGDPGDANCTPNTVIGAVVVRGNHQGLEVIGNTVGGAIIAADNSGPGPYPGDTSTVADNNRNVGPLAGRAASPSAVRNSAAPNTTTGAQSHVTADSAASNQPTDAPARSSSPNHRQAIATPATPAVIETRERVANVTAD